MSVTLSELRDRVRDRADMDGSDFVTDSEVNGYISSSYGELYDILVSRFEDYYVADPVSFTLASGVSSYDLPAGFYKLLGVDRKLGNNNYYPLKRFNFSERNNSSNNSRIYGTDLDIRYRILGDTLRFIPEDGAPGEFRLWYIPVASTLSLDADTVDGVNGWEEYIVVDAAIKCLVKEESDVSILLMQKKALMDRIEVMAQNRDIGEPQRITDVSELYYDNPFFYR